MTEQEILEAVEVILYNATYTNKPPWHRRFYYCVKDKFEFRSEAVTLLIALYQKLVSNNEREFLLKKLKPSPSVPTPLMVRIGIGSNQLVDQHQDFIFVFFTKIKRLDLALKMIYSEIVINSKKNNLFRALFEVLEAEPNTFDNSVLNKILKILEEYEVFASQKKYYDKKTKTIKLKGMKLPLYNTSKIENYKSSVPSQVPILKDLIKSIRDKIYEIKNNKLSDLLLEGVNLEIEKDQQQVQSAISTLGFNPVLSGTLSKIGYELNEAKDEFDFKSCIDFIRAFLNELCISIAQEIDKKKNIRPTFPIDSMGRARQYFRDGRVNFLSEEEDNFIGQFNAFISDKGVHTLQSEKEYARISKNLVIELGLFLVERLKKYLSNP